MTPIHDQATGTPPADAALIWPWAHNWAQPVVERLSWLTSIERSKSGSEQRRLARPWCRVGADYSHLLTGAEVGRYHQMMRAWKGRTWAVPAWWAVSTLTADATGTLVLDRPVSGLWAPGMPALLWRDSATVEVVTVASASGASIELNAAPAGMWPAGSRVLPLYFGRLPASQAATAHTGEVLQVVVTWQFEPGLQPEPDPMAWPSTFPDGASPAEPRAHLLGLVNNWATPPTITTDQAEAVFDPGVGGWSPYLQSDLPAMSWPLRVALWSDADIASMRHFLASHKGRAIAFWAECPALDVEAAVMAAGAVTLPSLRLQTNSSDWVAGLAYTLNGVRYVETATVVGAVATASGGRSGTVEAPRLVSGARLASDQIEIVHHRPGLAEITLPVVTCNNSGAGLSTYQMAQFSLPGGAWAGTSGNYVGIAVSELGVRLFRSDGAGSYTLLNDWLAPANVVAQVQPAGLTYSAAVGQAYSVRANLISGGLTSGPVNAWLPINPGGLWFSGPSAILEFQIAATADLSTILASGTYHLN